MADYNFGFVGSALEAGQHADANLDLSPPDTGPISFFDHNLADIIKNRAFILTVNGAADEFVWGQKWGNSKTKVAK